MKKITIEGISTIYAQNAITGQIIYNEVLPSYITNLINSVFKIGKLNLINNFNLKCIVKAVDDYNINILVTVDTSEYGKVTFIFVASEYYIHVLMPNIVQDLSLKADELLNIKQLADGKQFYYGYLPENFILKGEIMDNALAIYTDIVNSDIQMIRCLKELYKEIINFDNGKY